MKSLDQEDRYDEDTNRRGFPAFLVGALTIVILCIVFALPALIGLIANTKHPVAALFRIEISWGETYYVSDYRVDKTLQVLTLPDFFKAPGISWRNLSWSYTNVSKTFPAGSYTIIELIE